MVPTISPILDPFGRPITYLRVSVTDRCDFRCVYCMAENMTFLPKSELLSIEELEVLCRRFMAVGTRKIRLTGGEPLVRRNILTLIRNLGAEVKSGHLDEVTITTNGSQLSKMSEDLYDAGVRRINVSLDTLNKDKFRAITRWGDLNQVLDG
ncbi:MAG: radical SAM protein, partial [Proteobacteria bacterium]|nr:radical SAM protein [Pseudomonadota bacterium]